jgi:hypothetical protein
VSGDRSGVSVLAASGGVPSLPPRRSVPATAVWLAAFVGVGVLAGVVWWWLAPLARADADAGAVYLRGHTELQAAQDGWFAVVLGVLGVLTATAHAWRSSGRGASTGHSRAGLRQVQQVLALTAAVGLAGVIAWVTGSWLGPDDLATQVAHGARHPLTPLQLHSVAALLVGPFLFAFTAFLAAVFGAGPDRSR